MNRRIRNPSPGIGVRDCDIVLLIGVAALCMVEPDSVQLSSRPRGSVVRNRAHRHVLGCHSYVLARHANNGVRASLSL